MDRSMFPVKEGKCLFSQQLSLNQVLSSRNKYWMDGLQNISEVQSESDTQMGAAVTELLAIS